MRGLQQRRARVVVNFDAPPSKLRCDANRQFAVRRDYRNSLPSLLQSATDMNRDCLGFFGAIYRFDQFEYAALFYVLQANRAIQHFAREGRKCL